MTWSNWRMAYEICEIRPTSHKYGKVIQGATHVSPTRDTFAGGGRSCRVDQPLYFLILKMGKGVISSQGKDTEGKGQFIGSKRWSRVCLTSHRSPGCGPWGQAGGPVQRGPCSESGFSGAGKRQRRPGPFLSLSPAWGARHEDLFQRERKHTHGSHTP